MSTTITPRTAIRILLVYCSVVHGLMFAYDYSSGFEPFLKADRAGSRYESVMQLAQAGNVNEVLGVLSSKGLVGDYVPHALLYIAAGEIGVVLFQVLLQILSIVVLFRIALLLLGSPTWSLVAAMGYASLPHSLVFAHQLSSEALSVPLIVMGFGLVLNYRIAGKHPANLFAAAALLGLATLARPVTALLPVVLSPCLFRRPCLTEAGRATGFVLVGLAPLLLWMSFIHMQTGTFSIGNTVADLGWNLYHRVDNMTLRLPERERAAYTERYLHKAENERLSVSSYLAFAIERPDLVAEQSLRDLFVLSVKSGVDRLTVDYLDPSQGKQQVFMKWRRVSNEKGFIAATMSIAKDYPVVVLLAVVGAAVFLALFALAALGASVALVRVVRDRFKGNTDLGLVLLAIHTAYIFITAMVAMDAQSRHRYPAEFALVVLAVFGLRLVIAWFHRNRSVSRSLDQI